MARKKARPAGSKRPVVYTLGQGGPSLFDLRLNVPEIILVVNGPRMLFDHLEVVSSLGAAAGATANAWGAIIKGVTVVADCGRVSALAIVPELKTSRVGARVQIPLGPAGMYQTELTLRVRKKGVTFRSLFDSAFGQKKRTASYAVALYPAVATGHAEHHHEGLVVGETPAGPSEDPHAGHGAGHIHHH